MPKLKTKKALAKRIKITKHKKGLRSKTGRRHLLSGKSPKRKRSLKKETTVSHAGRNLMKKALPYGR